MAKVNFQVEEVEEFDGEAGNVMDKIYLSYSSMVDNDRPAKAPRPRTFVTTAALSVLLTSV